MLKFLLLFCCLLLGAPPENDVALKKSASNGDAPGLWPTPKLQALLLRRFADEVSVSLEFDDDQRPDVERLLVDRWSAFLDDNQGDFQPLFNEYLELAMQLEPPPKDVIQDWAERAAPLFSEMRSEIEAGVMDLESIARPEQKPAIRAKARMLGGALNYAEAQLDRYVSGDFDPQDFIEPTPSQRRARREAKKREAEEAEAKAMSAQALEAEKAAEAEASTPPDYIAAEISLWEEYVSSFVREFHLDDSQQSTAQSVLREMQRRASSYRDRRRSEIDSLERELLVPDQTPVQQADMEERIRRLYGPVDDMFGELKRRLDGLPSAGQRAKAAAEAKKKKSVSGSAAQGEKTESKPPVPAPTSPSEDEVNKPKSERVP